jgi:arylsulfatase A-like enzyme
VQMLDLFPTILDLVGIDAPSPSDGRSLLEAEEGGAGTLVSQLRMDGKDLVSARRGAWKLIHDIESGDLSLFDLASDPEEQRPLAGDEGGSLTQIRKELIEALEAVPRSSRLAGASSRVEAIPEDVRAALEQMGYIEPESGDDPAGSGTTEQK